MRVKPIALALLVVLSTSVVWAGGAFAVPATAAGDTASSSLQPTGVNDSDNDTKYVKIEPSEEWLDKPVDLSSAPEDVTPSGGESTETAAVDNTSDSVIMDPNDDDHPDVGETRLFLTSQGTQYVFEPFVLLAVGNHSEIWVAKNMTFPVPGDNRTDPTITEAQAEAFRTQFEENIYPVESRVFGTPDPRLGTESLLEKFGTVPDDYYKLSNDSKTAVLVDNIRDKNYYNASYPLYVAGYYAPLVEQYSDRNVINIDSYGWDEVNATDRTVGYEGTLAHEYEHLIHNDLDGDETTWVDEGMADFAEYVTGYGIPQGHVNAYEQLPYNSLTNWEDLGAINVLADYGEAYAFQMYLRDQFGTDFISNLAHEDANGLVGVEQTLEEIGASRDFYELFQDFSTAALLDDHDGHPTRDEYDIAGLELELNISHDIDSAGAWGTNYEIIDTSEKGPITGVTVTGTQYIGTQWTTATDPADGEGEVLYSGSGNLLDRFAIVPVDLSNAENPTLSFETYYNIEENWDYGFVQISTDGGETWQSLESARMDATPNPSAYPTVKENVPGYTGNTSGEWVSQSFDLSEYKDEGQVLISFRYVTDWASVQPGWYIRNVQVAGNEIPTDTTEPYLSLREATNDRIEYQFTFVGFKENGQVKVKQLDMRTFSEDERMELKKFLHNGNFEKVVVASAWAAHLGEDGRVPVGVEFEFAHENGNGNGPPEHAGNGAHGPPAHAGPGKH